MTSRKRAEKIVKFWNDLNYEPQEKTKQLIDLIAAALEQSAVLEEVNFPNVELMEVEADISSSEFIIAYPDADYAYYEQGFRDCYYWLRKLRKKALASRPEPQALGVSAFVTRETIEGWQKKFVDLNSKNAELLQENARLNFDLNQRQDKVREALAEVFPIVEAAYWDHQTARDMPGAGYNNKAQSLAGQKWSKLSNSSAFTKWRDEIKALLDGGGKK